MKKLLTILIAGSFLLPLDLAAQNATLNKVLELKMPKEKGDDFCGTRGGSVCWNPLTRKFYAAFAGNAGFPLAVFDIKGQRISANELNTMVDLRGLWYDPTVKKICGNGYNESGWFSYNSDGKGMPSDITIDHSGINQPDANSVGVYNPDKNEVIFFNTDKVSFYNADATSGNTLTLQLNQKKAENNSGEQGAGNSADEYNNTSVIYTGIPGSELGVLNTTKKQIELYDYSSGSWGKTLILPEDTPVEKSFNFAYSNGIYWLFDISARTWQGFK